MILDLFRKEIEFNNIQGYDDVKDIVRRASDADDNYNLLFIGPPASAKTLFLLEILESRKGKGVYFDGSNTTNRILDVLEEKRPKIICIDELDKMPKQFQDKLLVLARRVAIPITQMVFPPPTIRRAVSSGSFDKCFSARTEPHSCSHVLDDR
jgi:hypothetical protein